ncbi:MAG: Isoleucine-tRNA ligase [Candidatus Nomurabacteria bacterium GW2011_GWA1_40_8]|nr:MAG: Isoleucine-tRNA ligase [Candidatus Nomurabacteria bacterium GW2011_GWA1_40_8]
MAEKGETNNSKSEAALREEKVLEFWRENKIFEKSLSKDSSKGEFIFYEGPPTANGSPGIHHLEARAFKDAIPRYKTMRGYHVRRKGGWDTHGLAVEIQTEKKLGLNSKKAIEEYGIAKFNQECKESVWEYLEVWNKFTKRIGFWVDQERPYVTYHNDYIESVWNIVKKINEKKLLYKDYKVVPWCPRCGTALSSHELAQGYEYVKDLSVYVKFPIRTNDSLSESTSNGASKIKTYILAWTTTPWTLPGNVALAVGENIDYVKVKVGDEIYILAKERISIFPETYEILEEVKGKDLLGLEYEPLYPYFADTISGNEKTKLEKAYKVYGANFVTTIDGTGVVHTAVMYGQDDFVLGTGIGLPKHHLVGLDGKFLSGTGIFEGRFVKDEEVAIDIIKDLAGRELLLKKEKYEHSYPHCWRCHTPLIYYARDSWYIKMSDPKIKGEMIAQNKKINWEPSHIREGRFGEWLKDIKDWAISRERYWGTPLPVWVCDSCKKVEVIGSIADLKTKIKKSGNKYSLMRHGQSEGNVKYGMHGVVSSREENVDHLTKTGEEQVKAIAKKLKDLSMQAGKKFDLIFVSPFMRTRETVAILKDNLYIKDEQITFDKRLGEVYAGDFDGKPWDEYSKLFKDEKQRFLEPIHHGESVLDVKKRMGEFIYELEKKYQGKNILIISHGTPLWMLFAIAQGYNVDESIEMVGGVFRHAEAIEKGIAGSFNHFANAELRTLDFSPTPHNADYELDLHKPYVDEVTLNCECGGNLARTREVMDVWFDSGAMPFAQDHYPFENREWVEGAGYPADYICEAIDQTRGWFYTLHAVGVLMGRGKAYKNVICLGHLLDATGKKMSKSLGNVVDPFFAMDKYGVDTLRLWMYSVNQPGESKNFDEKTVTLLHNQVFGLLYNVLAFYELYRDKNLESCEKALPLENPRQGLEEANILDVWILARLEELVKLSTENLDSYRLLEPVRAMRDFIGDLSTWYLRRSRERIKNGDEEAKQTLYFVLKTLAKLLAPFAPFAAEDIWLKLSNEDDEKSVHLVEWPKVRKRLNLFGFLRFNLEGNYGTLPNMRIVREVVSLGLKERQVHNIPVRQPLAVLKLKEKRKLSSEYTELIKDELNVKEVCFDNSVQNEVELDVNITEELKQEGNYRELLRALQDMRKKMGLTPNDVISINFETDHIGKKLIQKFETDMKKTVLVSEIHFKKNDGEEVKIDDLVFKVKIVKI